MQSCTKRRFCPYELQDGVSEDHSLAWQALISSTRSCGQYSTDHSWIRCRVGLNFIFCSFCPLQREVVLCSCVHPLLLVTVGVVLCWRSPHSHTVKLYKYSFINDSLALCLYSGTVWGVLGMPVFLRGAGSDHAGGPNLVREPFCGKEFLYVPLEALSFFTSWDSSLCSSGPPEIPLAAEHCQGYSRVRWFLGVLKVWCNKKVCVDFGEVLCAIAPRYYIFCLQID